MKLAFWGKHIELLLKSVNIVRLVNKEKGIDERYELNLPKHNVNNLLFGKVMEFNHWGDLYCENMETGDITRTKMTGITGMFLKNKDKAKVVGHTYKAGSKTPAFRITGSWMDHIAIDKYDEPSDSYVDKTLVYKQYIVTGDDMNYWDETYRMPAMALQLNQLTDELKEELPPTDSRLRPDIRLMEEGDGDKSTEHKLRLEQEQRDRRKLVDKEPPAVYFTKEYIDGDESKPWYNYGVNRDYWEDKKNKDWDHLPRFFE